MEREYSENSIGENSQGEKYRSQGEKNHSQGEKNHSQGEKNHSPGEKSYTLRDDDSIGTVKIADDVVAMIAGLAAMEIDGISAMSGNITNELMSKVGVKNLAKGVKVEVFGKRVKVDISLIVDYGYNIPVISQKVQMKVQAAIQNMTGLEVTDVNIRIAGVNMTKVK